MATGLILKASVTALSFLFREKRQPPMDQRLRPAVGSLNEEGNIEQPAPGRWRAAASASHQDLPPWNAS